MKISFALFFLAVGIAAANGNAVNTTMCQACLENKFTDCDMGDVQNCSNATTDSCFSAAGTYKLTNGTKGYFTGVSRGCVPCHNVTEGCRLFKLWFDAEAEWSLLKCNMVCCKGDKCNNQTVDFPDLPTTQPTDSSTVTMTPSTDHAARHFPKAMIFAIAAIVAALFFN